MTGIAILIPIALGLGLLGLAAAGPSHTNPLAALVIPQAVLFGPSLVGERILLPLDILTAIDPRVMSQPDSPEAKPWNWMLSDQVTQHEPWRRYVSQSVRNGRLPLWHPANFGGYPILAANQTAIFSPYRLLDYLWPGPEAVAKVIWQAGTDGSKRIRYQANSAQILALRNLLPDGLFMSVVKAAVLR